MNDRDDQLPDNLIAMAAELERQRPIPSPTFRGELGRRLQRKELSVSKLSTTAVRRRVAALGSSGLGLLAIAALGTVGVGPLAS